MSAREFSVNELRLRGPGVLIESRFGRKLGGNSFVARCIDN